RTPGGNEPILLALPSAIPTLGEWGLLVLALLLAGVAFHSLRRHRRLAFLLLALMAAGAAAASAPSTLGGETNGWKPSGQLGTDNLGDGSPDLRAAFGRFENGHLYFRIDALLDQPPVAHDDTATVLEDSGATTIDVLANDVDPDGIGGKSVQSVTQPAHGT